MSKNVEEIILQARDEASAVIAAATSELGTMGSVLSRLATTAGPVGIGLAAVAGAAGVIVAVGAGVADTVEQLDLLADRTGVSIERLQVFQQIILEAGGSSESLTTALMNLNRSIAQGDPLLGKLGITTKDTFDAFMQLSDVFANSSDMSKKTEVAYQLLGAASKDLVGLLPRMGSTFKQMDSDMRSSGGLIGGTVAGSARDLGAELDKLHRNWSGTLSRIKQATVPWANEIVQAFNDVWDAASGKHKSPAEAAARNIADLQKEIASLEPFRAKLAENPTFGAVVSGQTLEQVDARLAALRLRLGKLQGLRAETEDEEQAIMAAFDAAARRTKGDSLSGVSVTPDKVDAKAKAREERLKDLQRIMGVTRGEAVQLAAALDRIEDGARRADITKKLTFGPEPSREVEDLNERITRAAELLGIARDRAQELVVAFDERQLQKQREELAVQLGLQSDNPIGPELPANREWMTTTPKMVGDNWSAALDQITSTAQILDDTLGGVFSGLEAGFNAAFSQIVAGTATVGSVLKSLWHSIVDAILAELARLAAAAVLKVVATALGIPGFGVKAAPAGGAAMTFSGPGVASFGSDRPAQTVNIYSYDLRDGVREMTSLSGVQRRASARVSYVGEY